jgi:hypothetical protein
MSNIVHVTSCLAGVKIPGMNLRTIRPKDGHNCPDLRQVLAEAFDPSASGAHRARIYE